MVTCVGESENSVFVPRLFLRQEKESLTINNALNSTVLFTVAEVQFACVCGEEGRENAVFAGKNTKKQ